MLGSVFAGGGGGGSGSSGGDGGAGRDGCRLRASSGRELTARKHRMKSDKCSDGPQRVTAVRCAVV